MNICVYGASADGLDGEYFSAAYELGRLLAREGHGLVFGGGRGGLMGECARGALEAGGTVTGIAPRFFDEPGILRRDCAEFIFTETMSERKQLMAGRADAFIALPGGIGTFEEFFETLTLKQLGRHCKPMVLLNTRGYYEPMTALLARSTAEGFMSHGCMELFSLCDTPAQALALVKAPSGPRGGIRRLSDYSK